jgi:hypothetical protein
MRRFSPDRIVAYPLLDTATDEVTVNGAPRESAMSGRIPILTTYHSILGTSYDRLTSGWTPDQITSNSSFSPQLDRLRKDRLRALVTEAPNQSAPHSSLGRHIILTFDDISRQGLQVMHRMHLHQLNLGVFARRGRRANDPERDQLCILQESITPRISSN